MATSKLLVLFTLAILLAEANSQCAIVWRRRPFTFLFWWVGEGKGSGAASTSYL